MECKWLDENLNISESDVVLDVGCGTGRHVIWLAEKLRNSQNRVIGCDFIQENIDFLNGKLEESGLRNGSGICCGATDFAEQVDVEECDYVIGIGIIQYLTNEEQMDRFANSCSEMIREGGQLILKHPLSFTESYLLDYYREDMATRYISMYYNLPDIMGFFIENFELMSIERTFREEDPLVGEFLMEIERDPRARQMWITLEKKKKDV